MTSAKPSKYRLAALPVVAFSLLAAMSVADPAASRRAEPVQRDEYGPPRPTSAPLLALVSLKDQRVTIYDKDGAILHSPVSSGQTGYETPVGIYSVLQKEAEHYSNRYDDASMPFMQRITWTGIAFHGGALPGYPASHGCVRLPHQFAERLFPLTKLGMRVVVSRYDVAPVTIAHPSLFKPTPLRDAPALVTKTSQQVAVNDADQMRLGVAPPADLPPVLATRAAALQAIIQAKTAEADEAAKKADAARLLAKQKSAERGRAMKALRVAETVKKRAEEDVADADRNLSKATSDQAKLKAQEQKDKATAKLTEATAKLEAAKTEFQPKIDDYEKSVAYAKAAEDTRKALLAEAHDAQRKMAPVSVFISRSTQKLYVRQAFEPILEAPITIRDPDQPIGTHIYTAVDYADNNNDEMRWNVVSIGGRRAGDGGDEEVSNRRGNDYYDYDDDDDDYGRRRSRRAQNRGEGRSAEATPTDAAAASAALDRITIPPDVLERISELVLPGSSLIVSDEPAHKETGKQTDFVVLISGEPQGGIKLRPKPRPEYYDDFYWGGGWGYNGRGRRGRDEYRGPLFQFW